MPFESHLELRHRPGHERWEVIQPLLYGTRDGRSIRVPAGYLSDLASVPRIARRWVDTQAPTVRRPAVLHDYLYTDQTHRFSKREADQIFHDALLEEGTDRALAWLLWQAVRFGGRGAWSPA